jgi:phosphoserine phosphatase
MSLPSWNDTKTKQRILEFVARVTDKNNRDYLPPTERIAAFDHDGTLWCEHPIPVQFQNAFAGLTMLAEKKPDLMKRPMYKAAVEKDLAWFAPYLNNERIPELLGMMLQAAAGETQKQYETRITAWLETARHPRFEKSYKKLVFLPMLDLIVFLRANDFRIFIISGGGMDIVHLISEEIYGVPRQNVVGDNINLSWEYRDGIPELVRQAGIREPYCDGPGKPINIQLHVGRPPILACGNTNGDIPMMEFAAATGKPYLNLLVKHDDAEREYNSSQSAELAQKIAKVRGWTIISMKQDFKSVFPD